MFESLSTLHKVKYISNFPSKYFKVSLSLKIVLFKVVEQERIYYIVSLIK